LNPSVRGERVECHRAVVVELVGTVLPEDVGGDTCWVGRVGCESVLGFLEETGVGAVRGLVWDIESRGRTYKL
jgi:hypothetical protein